MAVLLVQYQEEAWATSLGLCDLKIAFFTWSFSNPLGVSWTYIAKTFFSYYF